ncbi:MAG: nucleotide exchange factor GrpE [Planctomycetota bacterium]
MARRLEGKPFHLLAAHCQRAPREQVVAYIREKKLAADTPNFTVTSFGGHPKVKGNGYVPYYMVFDQHGKLVRHHMCGAYHGGDGLEMIEWVDKLLKETPEIYLGKDAYPTVPKLAARIGAKKGLPGAVKEVETRLAAARGEEKAELARLQAAVSRYRDRQLARAERFCATQPGRVLPTLEALGKDLKGTDLSAPVQEKLAGYKKSADLKRSIAVHKSFRKIVKRIEKLDPGKRRDKEIAKVEKLAAENEGLPLAATMREYVSGLK